MASRDAIDRLRRSVGPARRRTSQETRSDWEDADQRITIQQLDAMRAEQQAQREQADARQAELQAQRAETDVLREQAAATQAELHAQREQADARQVEADARHAATQARLYRLEMNMSARDRQQGGNGADVVRVEGMSGAPLLSAHLRSTA
eukprot:m.19519 g.19519  ORF g.19519 m.19519 type:complete len:150 (+) comp8473_c0_seq1:14-463(+)